MLIDDDSLHRAEPVLRGRGTAVECTVMIASLLE